MSSEAIQRIQQATNYVDPQLWVVTAQQGTSRGGMIATFVTKASIVTDCPRFLVGIAKQHHTWGLVEASGALGLHLIPQSHLDWVVQLGGRSGRDNQGDKLEGLSVTTLATGSPILTEAVAGFDCRVESRLDTGDRTVYLLDVQDAVSTQEAQAALRFSDLIARLPAEESSRLAELYARDQEVDRRAIVEWRADYLEAQS